IRHLFNHYPEANRRLDELVERYVNEVPRVEGGVLDLPPIPALEAVGTTRYLCAGFFRATPEILIQRIRNVSTRLKNQDEYRAAFAVDDVAIDLRQALRMQRDGDLDGHGSQLRAGQARLRRITDERPELRELAEALDVYLTEGDRPLPI